MVSDLRFLPPALAARSISDHEIVLPYADALRAIDHLERSQIRVLGWEGWLHHDDGHLGHTSELQGTVGLDELALAEAAALCRRTISEVYDAWQHRHPDQRDALHFCITVAAG